MSDQPPTRDFSIALAREIGIIQEINRLLLHPLGLSLYVNVDEKTGEQTLGGILDYRDDPEGVIYADGLPVAENAEVVAEEIERRGAARLQTLGYVIQPLPAETKQLTVRVLEHTVNVIPGPGEYDEGEESDFAPAGADGA